MPVLHTVGVGVWCPAHLQGHGLCLVYYDLTENTQLASRTVGGSGGGRRGEARGRGDGRGESCTCTYVCTYTEKERYEVAFNHCDCHVIPM